MSAFNASVLLVCALLAGCHAAAPPGDSGTQTASVPGNVTDLSAFEHFLDGRPTPAKFRARYPDVTLILPGEMATKELRSNNSRYFAELDAEGRIVGGQFG